MDYSNFWLNEELQRMRRDEIQREIAHERFMTANGLDLWSVIRRAIRLPRPSGWQARAVESARATRPLRAAHRPFPRGAHLVEPQPAGPDGDMRDTAA